MRDWVTNVGDTYYLLGSALGRASLPDDGARFSQGHRRGSARADSGSRRPPAGSLIACVGGGSNAIGLFHAFIPDDARASWSASKPAGAATRSASTRRAFAAARPACCRAPTATCCRTTTARSSLTHSVSAGLDYALIGPEHAWLHDREPRRVRRGQRRRSARRRAPCSRAPKAFIPALESRARRRRSDPARARPPRTRSSS